MKRLVVALICAAVTVALDAAGPIARAGIALTPRNFPNHKAADVENMFQVASQVGDVGVFIYQWSDPGALKVAGTMISMSKSNGLTPVIALSPTELSGMRSTLDLPRDLAGRTTFADKRVYERFIRDAVELAKLKPPYLCLATEINLLAMSNLKEFLTFAHVYKRLYPELKKISPETKIFVSLQWDFLRQMDIDEPAKVKDHSNLFKVFEPELDVVAITSYPSDRFATPSEVPADYYSHLFDHVGRDKEIMVMEIGWPSTGKGTDEEQAAFVKRLPNLMAEVKPRILAWSLLHDVNGSGLTSDLATTGLLTADGKAKPALAAFKALTGK